MGRAFVFICLCLLRLEGGALCVGLVNCERGTYLDHISVAAVALAVIGAVGNIALDVVYAVAAVVRAIVRHIIYQTFLNFAEMYVRINIVNTKAGNYS